MPNAQNGIWLKKVVAHRLSHKWGVWALPGRHFLRDSLRWEWFNNCQLIVIKTEVAHTALP